MGSLFLKLFKYISLFVLVLYSFIWLISPSATRFYSADFLQLLSQNHLALSEKSSIRYNPFLSHLSIYDLALVKKEQDQEVVLSVDELQLEVSLYKLLFDQLQITEFEINGLFIKVDIQGEQIEVAGISLADPKTTEIEQDVIEEVEQDASNVIVKMAQFNLFDANINLNLNGSEHLLNLKSLTIERVKASAKEQQIAIRLKGAFNQAPLSIDINAQINKGKGNISSDFTLSQLELSKFEQFLPEQISALSGKVNIQSKQEIKLTQEEIKVAVQQFEMTTEQLKIQQNDVTVTIEKQNIFNNNLLIKLAKNNAINIQGTALFEQDNMTVATQEQHQVLAHLAQLKLSDINFNITDRQSIVNIAAIDFKQFYASDDLSNDMPPLAQFSLLNIQQIAITDKSLAINKIKLSGLTVDAQLNEDKSLSNLVALPELAKKTPHQEDSQPTEQPEPLVKQKATLPEFALSIGEFTFTDNAHINFIDHSIKPIFERHVIITKLAAGPINNQEPETKSLYQVVGKSEEYAHFNFSGFAQPFLEQPIYHLKGDFKEVSLPAVSTYMKEALQYVFDSGQLDLSVDTTLTGTDIDGEMLILMRGLELTAAEDDEVNSMSDHSAIPFSVALGMLKDSDGNVELDIPLSGDTSSPSFGMSGFVSLLIKQATMMAAKDYLMTTFVPYANVISIAMTAGDYLLKIRFNDLEFPATKTELQPEHSEFLAQFSALLKDQADEHITLCAIAIAQDIGKDAGTKITDKKELSQLKKISLARMHAFKSYMVKTEKLASSRLLLCTPQIDSSIDAKARITFTN